MSLEFPLTVLSRQLFLRKLTANSEHNNKEKEFFYFSRTKNNTRLINFLSFVRFFPWLVLPFAYLNVSENFRFGLKDFASESGLFTLIMEQHPNLEIIIVNEFRWELFCLLCVFFFDFFLFKDEFFKLNCIASNNE